ncbi:dephospho-CoA kinase [Alkalibacillus aidingensis]|uniref:dephospho-CoA kinase n=1 Tax=Alkalibacillus aidingensis TaxID=2747607 RepID=UPI00166074F7|nr:dephospho-CoA kinase [Alkalibacillus aidingensis]
MTLVIGLTGSIATGKSTIAKMFREWEIPVIDADYISREVVEVGEKAYKRIVDHFGKEILNKDDTINRERLGQVVFQDESERKQLNAIIHPEIRKKMLQQRDRYIEKDEEVVVLDIPLLFESDLFHYVEKVLVVYVDPEIQLQRLMERDESTEEEAKKRINAQIPIIKKKERADAIIDNGGTIKESRQQLKVLLYNWGVKRNLA